MSWLGQFSIGIVLGIIILMGCLIWLATKRII